MTGGGDPRLNVGFLGIRTTAARLHEILTSDGIRWPDSRPAHGTRARSLARLYTAHVGPLVPMMDHLRHCRRCRLVPAGAMPLDPGSTHSTPQTGEST